MFFFYSCDDGPFHANTANSSDGRFFSAALGSTDRDFRISYKSVSLTDSADPSTLQTSELFRTVNNDRWLDCKWTIWQYNG